MSSPKVSAVIAASGLSERFSPLGKKQFVQLGGKPLLSYCLSAMESSELIETVVLVSPEREMRRSVELIENFGFKKIVSVVAGGEKRQISVRNGVRAVPEGTDMVLIHDAARPFLNEDIIKRVVRGCADTGVCICAVPVTDTLKFVEEPEGVVSKTIERENLMRAQTPQVFRVETLKKIYSAIDIESVSATDESQLAETMGIRVSIVQGSEFNMKITTPTDFKIAELMVTAETETICTE